MDLKNLSDDVILQQMKNLDRREKGVIVPILYHLREIQWRRLFSKERQSSLLKYVMEEFKYSEDVALNRIAAMQLLNELLDIESKIADGSLSLSNLAVAKTLFRKKSHSRTEKLKVLAEFENQSVRSARRIAARIVPEAVQHDKIRAVADGIVEIKFNASAEIEIKIEDLKGLLAHSLPGISLGDLFNKLCDLGLETWKSPGTSRVTMRQKPESEAGARRATYQRDGDKCVKCGSTHALEIDHIIPQAAGGPSTLENMRILCRNCNQRAAIEYFGRQKMEPFLRSPSRPYSVAFPAEFCILRP
ncbi:MAG: HNH endonuclease [Bdellovibrionales bacterium]